MRAAIILPHAIAAFADFIAIMRIYRAFGEEMLILPKLLLYVHIIFTGVLHKRYFS